MSAPDRVLGVDPGPTPGIVLLTAAHGRLEAREVVQCSAGVLHLVLAALDPYHAVIGVERFVVGRRASRSASAHAGAETRDQVGALEVLYPQARFRTAAQVKPWATDERLDAAGLLEATKGLRHARDAARHALFAAVHDGVIPDPLSPGAHR